MQKCVQLLLAHVYFSQLYKTIRVFTRCAPGSRLREILLLARPLPHLSDTSFLTSTHLNI